MDTLERLAERYAAPLLAMFLTIVLVNISGGPEWAGIGLGYIAFLTSLR